MTDCTDAELLAHLPPPGRSRKPSGPDEVKQRQRLVLAFLRARAAHPDRPHAGTTRLHQQLVTALPGALERLYLAVQARPDLTSRELAALLKLPATRASERLHTLRRMGLVERTGGRWRVYTPPQ